MRKVSKPRLTATYIGLSLLSIIWLIPIVWLIFQAFRESPTGIVGYFFPKSWTIKNFYYLFKDDGSGYRFSRWFINTLVCAVSTAALTTLFTLSTAYVLSRFNFRLRKPFMNIALILGMFPGFMSMIALYFLLKYAGLLNLVGLILIYSGSAGLSFYISKGFFDMIPKSLDEAARLDGASNAQIFFKIVLPLSKPIIIYTVMTSFLVPWADFIFASYILSDDKYYTVAVGLFSLIQEDNGNISLYFTKFAAGAVIVALPVSILFIVMQKFYVEGITGGSVKG